MKKLNGILWGAALIALGVIWVLNSINVININLFFDGWWTLFIIVPCAIGLVTDRDKFGNLAGLCLGIILLLCCRGILKFSYIWKLFIPLIIVLIGIKIIVSNVICRNYSDTVKRIKSENNLNKSGTAVFSGSQLNFTGEKFSYTALAAVFGGVQCDLRNAVIEDDCVIDAKAIFGGREIYVPKNLNVKVCSSSVFGGASDDTGRKPQENCHTLYVNATAVFGGVEISEGWC